MFDSIEWPTVVSVAPAWQMVLLSLLSLGVGFLGGFVGLALGTMRLPAMLLLGIPAPVAGGTNILVSTLSTIGGTVRHLRQGTVHLRVVFVMGLPAVLGSLAGGFLSDRVPEALLLGLAGLFVSWQGVEFLLMVQRGAASPALASEHSGARFSGGRMAGAAAIGAGVGLLGGAVGLILGSIRLPAMVRTLHINPRVAAGTNLGIGFLMGSFGFIGHGLRGEVDLPLLVLMGATAMVGSYFGAKLTGKVSLRALVLAMGLVLLGVGLLLLGRALFA